MDFDANPRYAYSKLNNYPPDLLLKIYLHENLPENFFKFTYEILSEKIQSYQKVKTTILAYFDAGTFETKWRLHRVLEMRGLLVSSGEGPPNRP